MAHKVKTIHVYTDPGHGWAKVKVKELIDLGICDRITPCSYLRGDYAYLEEDYDAGVYVKALELSGVKYKVKWHDSNKQSRIRSYYRFDGPFILKEYQRQCERAETLIAAKKMGMLTIVKVGE